MWEEKNIWFISSCKVCVKRGKRDILMWKCQRPVSCLPYDAIRHPPDTEFKSRYLSPVSVSGWALLCSVANAGQILF